MTIPKIKDSPLSYMPLYAAWTSGPKFEGREPESVIDEEGTVDG